MIIFQRILHIFGGNSFRPEDSGLFDPFIPLGAVKRVNQEVIGSDEPTGEADSFEGFNQPVNSLIIFQGLVLLASLILIFRLVNLQITRGQENYSLAEGNRSKTIPIGAPRGLIFDRNGVKLVENIPSFSLIFHGSSYPLKNKLSDRQSLADQIAAVTQLDSGAIKRTIEANLDQESIVLLEGINRDQALSYELKLDQTPGVEIIKAPVRQYADLPSLGHILGYIGKMNDAELKANPELLPTVSIGKTGLEKVYDRYLQGQGGAESLEVDALGRVVRSIGSRPPVAGQSLILGLDSSLQRQTAASLKESMDKSQAHSAAAVAIDVKTGLVLAMVSAPDFNNNVFGPTGDQSQREALLTDPNTPLINRAIGGQYPSGSTIKPFVASGALEEHVITPDTKLDTSDGKITVGQTTFNDWKVHGITEVTQAIAESNNIFFMAAGGGFKNISGLGANRLTDYYKKFGFGQQTGIDLPGEAAGLVPTPDWKKKIKKESWFTGDTYNLSIGQGDLLVTPLQLVRGTATIANNGDLLQPRLVKTIFDANGQPEQDFQPTVTRDHVVSSQTLSVVRQGMRRAVQSGSARSLSSLPIPVAAKTGTAQFNIVQAKTHSWFTAFAPYDNPQIAIAVIVEGGGEGFAVAAPVAKNMLENYFQLPISPILPPPPGG